MSRKCETCGSIDFGKWGYLGLIGYSLIVGMLGYVLSTIIYYVLSGFFVENTLVIVLFGIILLVPLYYIAFKEERVR